MAQFQHLIDYELWALDRLANALGAVYAPREPLRTFAHILNAYKLWYERIDGVAATVTPWQERTLDDCRVLLNDLEKSSRETVAALTPDRLSEPVNYRNTKGEEFANTVGEILQHVLLHSAYHRGQVNAAVRAAGGEPAVMDYIAFAREGKG